MFRPSGSGAKACHSLLWGALIAFLAIGMGRVQANAQAAAAAATPPNKCCAGGDSNCAQPEYSTLRVALVVGVNRYGGDDPAPDTLRNLKTAANDAITVADMLSQQSFVVRCFTDLSKKDFFDELVKLRGYLLLHRSPAAFDSSVILHFSGHGFKIDQIDYILLSGVFDSKQSAVEVGGVPVGEVTRKLAGLEPFNILIMFDACRNSVGLSKPDWANNFVDPVEAPSATIVYATIRGGFAHDMNAAIHAIDNGAYVFSLMKYLPFYGLHLDKVYGITNGDRDLRSIQTPGMWLGDLPPSRPWSTTATACDLLEAEVVEQSQFCRRKGSNECFSSDEVCVPYRRLPRRADPSNTALGPNCSRERVLKYFDELAICNPSSEATLLSDSLNITKITVSPNASVGELRKQALLVEAGQKWAKLFTQIDKRAVALGPQMTAQTSVQSIRNEALDFARSNTQFTTSFSDRAQGTLRFDPQANELNVIPNRSAGTTGRLVATGEPRIDCITQPCSQDWVMARVPTAKGPVDGWVPASRVVPAPAARSLSLKFDEKELVPDIDSRKSLLQFIQAAKNASSGSVEVIGVVGSPASDELRVLARARVTNTVNTLFGRISDRIHVTSRVVEAANVDNVAPVTVDLISP
ncbi:MAG: hypothetical protein QOJ84_4196 [Bradyrhizobium sp.]|jgi:hypothetical protein|nr:hypothetical protein [Bradyrhizobium sp.]